MRREEGGEGEMRGEEGGEGEMRKEFFVGYEYSIYI